MPLFVAKHQHDANSCPAQDPNVAKFLLEHLSDAGASPHGVRIRGEAVLDGQHTLYLILEADAKRHVDTYLQPFGQAGSVEVWPASTCEDVVARESC